MTSRTTRSQVLSGRGYARLTAVAALGVTSALVAGCSGGSSSAVSAGEGPTKAGALDNVTFLNILPLESLSFSPELLADTGGFFKKEGLHVSFQLTKGSAQAIQTVIAGKALITRVGDIETMVDSAKGAPIVNIGTATKHGTIRIVSSTRKPLTKASDFAGTTIGLPSAGGTSATTIDLVNASAGNKPTDTKKQVVGLAPGVFNLVDSGRIDAYVVSLDTAIALKQQQPHAVVYDPNDAITAGAQLYLTSKSQAKDPKKADELKRYLKAINEAVQFMIKDKANGFAKTMKLISSKYKVPALADPKVGVASLTGYVDSFTAAGPDKIATTVPATWDKTYQEIVSAGLVKGGLQPDSWYTNDFAPGTH
jgi:NitT/TauT family transport system substrate-binding protein